MRSATLLLAVALIPSFATAAEIPKGSLKLITKGTDGNAGTDDSIAPEISSDGKSLAIATLASNLGPGTYNGFRQVMRFTPQGKPIESISRMAAGQLANLDCWTSRLSKSGRYVAFESDSSLGLVGPPGGSSRVFWRDTKTGELVHVSIGPMGNVANKECYLDAISENGRYVLFHTTATNMLANNSVPNNRGYLHDVETGTTELVTVNSQSLPLDGYTFDLSMSGDARQVFFSSPAANLGNGPNVQVYARDRKLGKTTLLSKNASGSPGAAPTYLRASSRNGRFVLMGTYALNLGFSLEPGNLILLDRKTSELRPLDITMPGMKDVISVLNATISNDGRRLMAAVGYETLSTNTSVPSIAEFDLKTGKRWIVASQPGGDLYFTKLSFRASAKGDWVFIATNIDLLETNGKSDGYLYRAH